MLDVVDALRENDIPVRLSDDGEGLGEWTEKTIMGSPLRPKFWIEIPEGKFEKANFMLQEIAETNIQEEDLEGHPFNNYSVPELQEVLVEESDWSPEAVVIARRLLLRRGGDVDLKRLRDKARARLLEEYKPGTIALPIIIFVTLLALGAGLVLWVLGVMVAFGWLIYYAVGSRRDPKGNRHPSYNETTRSRAQIALGVLTLAILVGLANFLWLKWYPVADIDSWLWWWR